MRRRAFTAVVFLLICALMIASPIVSAQVPGQINIQGRLTDGIGAPVADGHYDMGFALYPTDSGGDALWSEAQSVWVANGVYNAVLGQPGNELSADLFSADLYLGLTVGGDDEMAPRLALTSVAYAFKAEDAETLGGLAAADFLTGSQPAVIDTSDDGYALSVNNSGTGGAANLNGFVNVDQGNLLVQGEGSFDDSGEAGVLYLGDSMNYIKAVHGSGVSIGAFDAADAIVVEQGTGNVGIGTSTPAARLDVAGTVHSSGALEVGSPVKSLAIFTDGAVVDIKSNGAALGINYPGDTDTVINVNGGRVGIGKADPGAKLDVASNADTGRCILGSNSNGNFGYLGGSDYGVYGENTNVPAGYSGPHGYIGGTNVGVYGSIGDFPQYSYAGFFEGPVRVEDRFVLYEAQDDNSDPMMEISQDGDRLGDASLRFHENDNDYGTSPFSQFVANINYTMGMDTSDNSAFKIAHHFYTPDMQYGSAPLTGDDYFDANTMVTIHPKEVEAGNGSYHQTKAPGIIDFNHQSRAKSSLLESDQPIPPATWTGVEFNAIVYDEHGEVVPGSPGTPAVFTARETGYYQVNARIEFMINAGSITPPAGGNDAYVSIAIYHNQSTYCSLGTNLQIFNVALSAAAGPSAGCFAANNAPNVNDIVFLQAGETIEIHAYQSSGDLIFLSGATVGQNYFSIHKLS